MNSSLYTGVLGLKNHQTRMDVIGNNIANVNTFGFKRGRATFADLLSRTYFAAAAPRDGRGGINPLQVGLGMSVAAVTNIMTQGQLETTGRLTDVAIDGNGWFVLKDGSGSSVFTRDGAFGLDKQGNFVNANGWFVQGWTRVETTDDHDFTVDTQRPVTNIDFQYGEKMEAAATNKVGLKSNLDEHSRSLIADGIDPKEGFATTNDLLVDLYDSDPVNPQHLGIREGDWLEIHVDTRDIAAIQKINTTASTINLGNGVGMTIRASNGTDQTVWAYTGLIDKLLLPMAETVANPITLTDSAGVMNAGNRVDDSPQQLADLIVAGNNGWTLDPSSGVIYSTAQLGAASTLQFNTDEYSETTFPYEPDKYLYFQISNDTTIGDLENSIQKALDSIDVNGTMKGKVKFNAAEAKFEIYNDPQTGNRDRNDLHVSINAVSGAGIRRGYLLRESTWENLPTSSRLGITNGSLGGAMSREVVDTFDYQTSVTNLDYGSVQGYNLYGQVTRAHLTRTAVAGDLVVDVATAGDWTGYSNTNALKMLENDVELAVDGTVWAKVNVFTGAANEYRVSNSVAGSGVPAIIFNTAQAPAAGAKMVLSYRTDSAPNTLLVEGTDYTIDATTGRISMMWDAASPTADSVLGNAVGGANFTGTIRLTADYTTEDRSLVPPGALEGASVDGAGIYDGTAIMNNRWADFAYEFADISSGGAGNARTDFNNVFAAFNASRSSVPNNGVIADQDTSSQPTMVSSSRLQSAEAYRTSIDVYDSLGDTHTLQFIFTHVGSNYDLTTKEQFQNRWYWRAELPYSDTFAHDSMEFINETSATASNSGEIQFNENGLIKQTLLGSNIGPIMFDSSPIGANGASTGAVDTTAIRLDMDGHGSPIDGITQYASSFTTRAYEQNGWAMGILETFAVDQNGVIEGTYSNNVVKPIAQIALAMFTNQEGLSKEGNNLFRTTANTGLPAILPTHTGGTGAIIGGTLEQSNVDIVEEFTNMIITERGFQANSRIVTTSDEMLVEVINMKR